MGDNFFVDFSFFTHRFCLENLWNFFSQMPEALGECWSLYKVKNEENSFWGEKRLHSLNARTRETTVWVLCLWHSGMQYAIKGKNDKLSSFTENMVWNSKVPCFLSCVFLGTLLVVSSTYSLCSPHFSTLDPKLFLDQNFFETMFWPWLFSILFIQKYVNGFWHNWNLHSTFLVYV